MGRNVRQIRLGKTGLTVSEYCLGTMSFGSNAWKSWVLDEAQSRPLLARAVEAGITFFDMANWYSLGVNEEMVTRALLELVPRDHLILATKVYYPMSGAPNDGGLSRKHILRSVDASLRRMKTDYIDLLVIHAFDQDVPIEETMCALHEIIQAAMAWENYHLYQFTVGDRVYGEPDPEDMVWGRKIYQAKGMRLGTLLDRDVTEFLYTYDFGDDWQHKITVEEVSDAEPGSDYPRFIDGERTAPPEDVGGPPGFIEFVEAMAKPRHPQHKDLVRW